MAIQTIIKLICVLQEGAAENVTILLLGNKSDCAERQVKTQDGEILAKVWSFLRHYILSHSVCDLRIFNYLS